MTTAKLGPWARSFSCMSVRGVLERLWTHLTLLWFADVISEVVTSDVGSDVTSELSLDEVTSATVE